MIATSIPSNRALKPFVDEEEQNRTIMKKEIANMLMKSEHDDEDEKTCDSSISQDSTTTTDSSDCENDQIMSQNGNNNNNKSSSNNNNNNKRSKTFEEEFESNRNMKNTSNSNTTTTTTTTPVKPKRALNAYNLFFRHERALLLMEANNDEKSTLFPSFRTILLPSTNTNTKNEDDEQIKKMRLDRIRHVLKNNPFQIDEGRRRPHRKTHGKVGFRDLARHIADSWKSADEETRSLFSELAAEDLNRHRRELAKYKLKLQKRRNTEHQQHQQHQQQQSVVSKSDDLPQEECTTTRVHDDPPTRTEKRRKTKKRKSSGDVKKADVQKKKEKKQKSQQQQQQSQQPQQQQQQQQQPQEQQMEEEEEKCENNIIQTPILLDQLHDALSIWDDEKSVMGDLDAEIFGSSHYNDPMFSFSSSSSTSSSSSSSNQDFFLGPLLASNCAYSSVPDLVSEKEAGELKDYLSALNWNLFEINYKDISKSEEEEDV